MKHHVVTSFSPAGEKLYGVRFVETFKKHWHPSVGLAVYYEGQGNAASGADDVDLLLTDPCRSFLARHRDNAAVAGRERYPGKKWKAGLTDYNFRFDAYKFARKVFAIAHAARHNTGKLFWVDADVETHADVPVALLNDLLPDHISLCYLARPGYHSECGFVGFNLDLPETRAFLAAFEEVYAEDGFFDHSEWHDSWIFDRVVERLKPSMKAIAHNNRGQPFADSVLKTCMSHFKGKRKDRRAA